MMASFLPTVSKSSRTLVLCKDRGQTPEHDILFLRSCTYVFQSTEGSLYILTLQGSLLLK